MVRRGASGTSSVISTPAATPSGVGVQARRMAHGKGPETRGFRARIESGQLNSRRAEKVASSAVEVPLKPTARSACRLARSSPRTLFR